MHILLKNIIKDRHFTHFYIIIISQLIFYIKVLYTTVLIFNFQYAELLSRGNFTREDIVTVLTANHGNIEAAYLELNKTQLKPFLMRIWGPPAGNDNESGNLLVDGKMGILDKLPESTLKNQTVDEGKNNNCTISYNFVF